MEEEVDLATAVAVEVAKQIPVKDAYDDAVKPGAQQVGNIVEDITKTVLLALAPIQYPAALQDRFRNFLDKSVRRVPEDNRLPPPPQVLGPVLEGIRYEPEDSPISEMFSQLLSSSIDQTRVHNAHPAFAQIVRQLSADEATLLSAMWTLWKQERRSFRQWFTQDYERSSNTFSNIKMELDEIPRANLMFPENVEFYGQHLYALGITAFFDSAQQEPLYDENQIQNGIRLFKELRFTDVGHKFMEAVSL
ncbi:DUF4393 domain-containing protein [Rhizobium mayense]|uniref:DUF4393 domain-containing protein n=1 Tax=Rhizobium mayense TaxID=1312184 RepID=A0ABT7JT37_9HYPH|nr:DUF4393 domain-containing protein [Rhizobium mayense]MDL2399446.1 DUF4393 domain-containing protein [Rhizobium mayense]